MCPVLVSTSEETTEQILEKSVCNVVWYEGERLCEQELGGADQVSLVLQWFWLCLGVWLRLGNEKMFIAEFKNRLRDCCCHYVNDDATA